MTTTKIIIEKNIPMEKIHGGQPQIYPYDSMKVGDSFEAGEYERNKANSIYGSIIYYQKKPGNTKKKFVCRKTKDNKIRIWREK